YGAIENLNQAINLDPNNSEFYSYRGSIRFLVEDVTEAIKDTEQAININNRTADNYLQLGLYLVRIKEFQKAIDNYTKALEINPYLTLALLCRSRAYLYFGDFKKALEDCELMLCLHQDTYHSESEPNSFSAFLSSELMQVVRYPYEVFEMRAYTRYSLKDWNGAIEDFTYIIRNPVLDKSHKIYYYYYYRAIAYWKQGDKQKAIIDCREAINLNQEFADAYKIKGLMLCKQGEPQKGIGIWDLQKAAKLYFKQGDIKSSESILETIRNLDTPEETLCINATIIDLQKRVQALESEQLQRQLILDPVIRQNRSDLYKLQQQLGNIQPSIEIHSAQIGNLQEEVTDIRLIQQHQSAKLDDLQQQFKDFQYQIAEFINANILDIEVLQLHMDQLELVISNVSNSESAAKQIIELNEYLERVNPQYQYKLLFNRYESHQIVKKALNQTKKQLIMVCPWLNSCVVQPLIKDFQKILEIGYVYVGYGYQGDINDLKRTGIKVTHLNLLQAAEKEGKAWKYDAIKHIKHLLKLDKFKLRLALTHAKFLICDDEFAMFGSHNFLTSGPNKNERELGLFTTDQRIINQLIADFENADNVEEEN
ncbi:MAG: tetratricopeptide repeat protein, partial [Phormidium sp.]